MHIYIKGLTLLVNNVRGTIINMCFKHFIFNVLESELLSPAILFPAVAIKIIFTESLMLAQDAHPCLGMTRFYMKSSEKMRFFLTIYSLLRFFFFNMTLYLLNDHDGAYSLS